MITREYGLVIKVINGNKSVDCLKAFPLRYPPLGECPKDKGGAVSGEEKASPPIEAVTDEGSSYPFDQ